MEQQKPKVGVKNRILRFRAVCRDIFEAIRDGRKKIETRAATPRYRKIKAGDTGELVCGKDISIKTIGKVRQFKSIAALLRIYKPWEINPSVSSKAELEKIYYSFPHYREKIKKYGLIALLILAT